METISDKKYKTRSLSGSMLACAKTLRNALPEEIFLRLAEIVRRRLREPLREGISFRISPLRLAADTISLFAEKVEPDPDVLTAMTLYACFPESGENPDVEEWGEDIFHLVEGMRKAGKFSAKTSVADKDNYRGLLLSLAGDIRVIIAMIVRSLALMRMLSGNTDAQKVRNAAFEANYLYAQLAHRLGLYSIKSELEDLALKFTDREIYRQIASRLNQTKADREAYISAFIDPVRKKLQEAGLRFEIKGRTKTISSIWHKIRTKKVDMNHIYDLFAIRVIIDTPPQREKADCWLAYSIVADMYTANPARMRDWISIPKSNGYESLHATVLGPGNRWVEVQFRTKRMDLVAEKGLAAHWKYKGGKADPADKWMNNVRDILETADSGPLHLMKDIRPDETEKEVFAFTPKGDLLRLRPGSTVLDFAFAIHSRVGSKCAGAIVNGRHEKISYRIKSGDTVEIITGASQSPRPDWLNIAVSTKARNKIRQTLNEEKMRRASLGKELLDRRLRNRKLEIDDASISRLILRQGYKHASDFYADLADEKEDLHKFLTLCQEEIKRREETEQEEKITAEEFRLNQTPEDAAEGEALVIGAGNVKGMKYRMARCCSPLHGDEVFGFISNDGYVKIHKTDCPNAFNLRKRYPYRIIPARWQGDEGSMQTATLRITGIDDIGIVTTITSLISKEKGAELRNISIDSNDGIFHGYLRVSILSNESLKALMKKIAGVKGVKEIIRQ